MNKMWGTCNHCGDEICQTNAVMCTRTVSGKVYYKKKTCNKCHMKQAAVLKRLKRENEYPEDSRCYCCNRIDRLILDHCHHSWTFRGWLCRQCNTGYGLIGDTQEAALQLLKYAFRDQDNACIRRQVARYLRNNV